jgi:hypothetical protein
MDALHTVHVSLSGEARNLDIVMTAVATSKRPI